MPSGLPCQAQRIEPDDRGVAPMDTEEDNQAYHEEARQVFMDEDDDNEPDRMIDSLKQVVKEADDPRLRTLIDGNCTSIVARWLVGRNDVKSDELRYELLFDERVDSIDKSRLLERLLHRQGEDEIQELAGKLLSESTDELILSAAQNLYTA